MPYQVLPPEQPPPPVLILQDEAIQRITAMVMELESERENLSENLLRFYVTKLVMDMLDYCHRRDLPEALIYTAVDLIRKRLADTDANELTGTTAPLKRIKQDDVEYEFALNNVDLAGCLSDLDFNSIKAKLNLYRKVVSF